MKLASTILVMTLIPLSYGQGSAKDRPKRSKIDVEKVLAAVREVENYKGRDGSRGERGEWQLMPFNCVLGQGGSKAEARLHAGEIINSIEFHHWPDDIVTFATIWKVGEGNFRKGKITSADRDYAVRVANLYFNP